MTKSLFIRFLLVTTLFVAGCNSADNKSTNVAQKANPRSSQVETVHADGVRRITIQDFEELRRKGGAFIVDVRNQAAYDQGHIPGAKLIPSAEILNHLNELPRDKTIVTYCS
jgi:3-mercaptopyruvate sulfurtransferase SseA